MNSNTIVTVLSPVELNAHRLIRRFIRRFVKQYQLMRLIKAANDRYDQDFDNYDPYDGCCSQCGGYSTVYCEGCNPNSRGCLCCGKDIAGSDWAWTGHCSRWCATSYDKECTY